jgi:antitoxin (DNA-binding transcriptional repressor) of toxin-antitoxin stability system
MQTITATDLARHTRQILDTVASRGETVAVERNNVLIAKIVPSDATMTASQALAGLLPTLTPRQGSAWLNDSRAAFDETVRDPWA